MTNLPKKINLKLYPTGELYETTGAFEHGASVDQEYVLPVSGEFEVEFRYLLATLGDGCGHTTGEPPTSCNECTEAFIDWVLRAKAST